MIAIDVERPSNVEVQTHEQTSIMAHERLRSISIFFRVCLEVSRVQENWKYQYKNPKII